MGAFLSFSVLILVTFLLLRLEAVSTTDGFRILRLTLCLVGMHSAAVSKRAWKKFSSSLFGVRVSDLSCSASNFFLGVNVYSYLVSLLLSRVH